MNRFQCGQIWLVNFDPSFGHEYKKVRPGLTIQGKYIDSGSLLTLIPLSSQTDKQTELDILVKRDYQK
ncbi:MAG: type II toxin-antitoxin system PemK/MazF family toxin [Candidatus Omnitrophota bacterium]